MELGTKIVGFTIIAALVALFVFFLYCVGTGIALDVLEGECALEGSRYLENIGLVKCRG